MTTKQWPRALCLMIAALLLLASTVPAQATPYTISEMPAGIEELVYSYWLSQPQQIVLLHLGIQTQVMYEEDGISVILLNYLAMPGTAIGLFAFQNVEVASEDLSLLDADKAKEALRAISAMPELLTPGERVEIAPDTTALWVSEPREGIETMHLVAFADGWIYNAMAQAEPGMSIDPKAKDEQLRLLQSLFMMENTAYSRYALEGDRVALSVPAPFVLTSFEKEDGITVINICSDETGPLLALSQLFAFKTDAADDETLDDMGMEALRRMLRKVSDDPEASFDDLAPVPGQPGLYNYLADGMPALAALHRGWLMLAIDFPRDETQQWAGDLKLAALNAIMGREAAWPVRQLANEAMHRQGDDFVIALGEQQRLLFHIPDGYEENITANDEVTRIVGFHSEDGPDYILRVIAPGFELEENPDDSMMDYMLKLFKETLTNIVQDDAPGETLAFNMTPAGLFGRASGMLIGQSNRIQAMYTMIGRDIILLTVRADEGETLPGAPIYGMPAMLTIE